MNQRRQNGAGDATAFLLLVGLLFVGGYYVLRRVPIPGTGGETIQDLTNNYNWPQGEAWNLFANAVL